MSTYEQTQISELKTEIRKLRAKLDAIDGAMLRRRAILGRGGGGRGALQARFIKYIEG